MVYSRSYSADFDPILNLGMWTTRCHESSLPVRICRIYLALYIKLKENFIDFLKKSIIRKLFVHDMKYIPH